MVSQCLSFHADDLSGQGSLSLAFALATLLARLGFLARRAAGMTGREPKEEKAHVVLSVAGLLTSK